jgi:hypothetical protein
MLKNILFFDNESDNWKKTNKKGEIVKDMAIHEEHISFIEIDENTVNNLVRTSSSPNQAYLDYFKSQNNTYANFIDTNPDKTKQYLNKPHVNNGITPELLTNIDLNQWLNGINSSALFFDWDRTITCVEGMVTNGLPLALQQEQVTYTDLLLFLMGGEERLQFIKSMFQDIMEHDIKFFILTHNLYASNLKGRDTTRPIYINLIKLLLDDSTFNVNNILYSSADYDYKKGTSACYTMITTILPECERIITKRRELGTGIPTIRNTSVSYKTRPPIVSKGGKRSKRRSKGQRKKHSTKKKRNSKNKVYLKTKRIMI